MKSFLQNSLLLCVVSLITILICEFALALVLPQKTLFPRYVTSTEFPIAFPPNTRMVNSQGSQWEFIYNTNTIGRRGAYLPLAENYDSTNVVILGDSFTFGIGVNDDEIYTRKISEQLGTKYAVINGGMAGWGIDSEIKWFYKYGTPYKPKYVVLQFTTNDLADSYTGVTKVEAGEFKFYPYTYQRPAWQVFVSESSVLQNSHLFSLFRTVYDHLNKPAKKGPQETKKKNTNGKKSRQINYLQFLELFAQKLNQQNVKLIFVSVTHQPKEPLKYRYDLDKFDLIKQAVKTMGDAGLLHYVPLPLDEMQDLPVSPEGHQWASGHHKLVGQAVAKVIIELEK